MSPNWFCHPSHLLILVTVPRLKIPPVLARLLQIGIEIEILRDDCALAQLLVQFLSQGQSGELIGLAVGDVRGRNGDGSVDRTVGIRFVRVVDAPQEVQGSVVRLDGVKAESTGVHAAQIQVLQRVAHEVRGSEGEQPRIHVAVVAQAAGVQVGDGTGSGKVICGVDRTGVERDLVVERGMHRVECQGEVFGLAVSASHREAHIGSASPAAPQSGMQ